MLVAVLLLGWLWPAQLGGCTSLVVVSGGSMEPTYAPGDLLVARCGEPAVGDVVVYEPPTVPGARVVHRVVGGDAAGWELQGDANDWLDPWQPEQGHVLGRVVLHLPGLGITGVLLDPLLWVALVVVGAGLALWPGREEGWSEDVPADAAGRGTSRRPAPAYAAGSLAVLLALAAAPVPADAARLAVVSPTLLAWSAPVDLAPDLPAAACSTPDPDLPCTAEVRMGNVWDAGYDLYVVVRDARTGGSTAMVPWTVTLDFSDAPFPWVPRGVDGSGLVAHTSCTDLPLLTVTGRTDWGQHHQLGPGQTREIWLQAHSDPVGNLVVCP